MFKSSLTNRLYDSFLHSFESPSSQDNLKKQNTDPFVYVDDVGIKYIANFVNDELHSGQIYALTIAEDGIMEMLSLAE